ncbi:MAG: GntR family transcriptional regulator [Candidatus Babeliales bacterium]|nr:GntR family transcriptional regulator [Candidatus Babeliales bacterium]
MPKISHSFVIQQAYNQIQNNIINGTLLPEQSLSLVGLSDQLKIEKMVTQKVLCDMAASGLITTNNDGTFNFNKITESMIRETYRDLLQIEDMAIAQSIKNWTPAWQEGIKKALQELENALNQPGDPLVDIITERIYKFHYSIIANCNCPTLFERRLNIYQQYTTFIKIFVTSLPTRTQQLRHQKEHRMIAQAALNKDAKTTCRLNHYHLLATFKPVLNAFKKINKRK